ncbi:ABC transporter ATP-binding protein [Tardisphaera miroshnichenkoae]
MADSPLSVGSLSSGYFGKEVLHDVTFDVKEAGIYVVLGLNGAGKTTLFRTIAGVLKPLKGNVTVFGRSVSDPKTRSRICYLSHYDAIPEGMTVAQAVDFYAKVEGAKKEDVDRVLQQLSLEELRKKPVGELSQGQRKRVSMAKVFLRDKDVYLLDEPTTNLDPVTASDIRKMMGDLSREKVVLYSSHNLYEARDLGRNVIVINEGKLVTFTDIDKLKPSSYSVAVRIYTDSEEEEKRVKEVMKDYEFNNGYYVIPLSDPSQVNDAVQRLIAKGMRIREIKEAENPLESLLRDLGRASSEDRKIKRYTYKSLLISICENELPRPPKGNKRDPKTKRRPSGLQALQ